MASTSKSPAKRAKRKSRTLAFPVEFRLRIVKLFLEEGYSARLLVEQFGISTHSVQRWVRAYRLHGEAGLAPLAFVQSGPNEAGKPVIKKSLAGKHGPAGDLQLKGLQKRSALKIVPGAGFSTIQGRRARQARQ